ncbi:MAG: circularly permuted type 2 ATP-grasp protein, partial [Afipia sp.]
MADTDSGEKAPRAAQRDLLDCTRGYAPLPGIPDEFLGAEGQPREVWTRFFDAFSTLSPGEIERRFASADQHMRDAGVTYRAPGEAADRSWPLSHLPLLIDEVEWKQISEGVAQRAELFEQILRDLYGEGRLIAEGALPAAAIAGSAEYLRSVCGVTPPGGQYLNLYAADIGRGPDGRWWVLNDR